MVTQEVGNFLSVGRIFMDSKLQVFAELFVEFLVVVLILTDVFKKLHALFDQVFPDDLQDLALLQHFSGDVQRQVLRIHNSLNKVQIFWYQLFTVVHDENSSHIQLDIVPLLFVLKEIKGCPLGHKQKGTEFQLTFHREVLDG